MRLHELTSDQIGAWKRARLEAGQAEYGDSHLQRYNLIDVMEELLDAVNILDLWADRMERAGAKSEDFADAILFGNRTWRLIDNITESIFLLTEIDKSVPDHLCTDERGGRRIWWSELGGDSNE